MIGQLLAGNSKGDNIEWTWTMAQGGLPGRSQRLMAKWTQRPIFHRVLQIAREAVSRASHTHAYMLVVSSSPLFAALTGNQLVTFHFVKWHLSNWATSQGPSSNLLTTIFPLFAFAGRSSILRKPGKALSHWVSIGFLLCLYFFCFCLQVIYLWSEFTFLKILIHFFSGLLLSM